MDANLFMRALWFVLCCAVLAGCRQSAKETAFRVVVLPPVASKPAHVEVVASDPAVWSSHSQEVWESILTLSADGQSTSVVGTYRVEGNRLIYQSQFGLVGGVTYRVRFDPSPLLNKPTLPQVETFAVLQSPSQPRAAVTRVLPSADVLPCNQLKFYVFFSHPMREGDVFENLQILNKDGTPIATPFREVELWNEDNTRLTLYIHPGRIKRGIKLREEIGPVLEPNQTYTLVIGKGLVDADGGKLVAPFRKTFKTTADDRTQPDIKHWELVPPPADTKQPLKIRFNETLDYALLQRMIGVEASNGQRVTGKISVDDHERHWRFTPSTAWTAGTYRIVVDTLLEDMAGNSLRKPFEVNTDAPPPNAPPTVAREFVVSAEEE